MGGNLQEWCGDVWHDYDVPREATTGLALAGEPSACVVRGGGFTLGLLECRSASRNRLAGKARNPSVGFRPVRTVDVGHPVPTAMDDAERER